MLPLHYASFFDAAPILRVLLKASNARGKVKELVNSMLDLCSDLYIVTVDCCGSKREKVLGGTTGCF